MIHECGEIVCIVIIIHKCGELVYVDVIHRCVEFVLSSLYTDVASYCVMRS